MAAYSSTNTPLLVVLRTNNILAGESLERRREDFPNKRAKATRHRAHDDDGAHQSLDRGECGWIDLLLATMRRVASSLELSGGIEHQSAI